MTHRHTDGNQAEIVKTLRGIPGIVVKDTHALGDGFPDIEVGFRGRNYLFEIKDPAKPPNKRKLTSDEVIWHRDWTGQVNVVLSAEEIFKVIGIN